MTCIDMFMDNMMSEVGLKIIQDGVMQLRAQITMFKAPAPHLQGDDL